MVTTGRESSPAGFWLPRQLQAGESKALPARKQGTAYSASNASAKCRNYTYRNRGGRPMSGKLTPYHEASASSIFRHKPAPEDLHIGGQLSTTK
jgi:hypothetical protein